MADTGEERDGLAERGRRLASERDDLIALGVDPSVLAVPLRPGYEWEYMRPVSGFGWPHGYPEPVEHEQATHRRRPGGEWEPIPSSADDCGSCGEPGAVENECPKSERPCGHHCNHSWESDVCHWCGATFGEDDGTTSASKETP